ncbi:hypothetical protein NC652_022091 [Populus alba x Populus x berolinensis]|nr:hypothetical protein NC652_022091 [Populus alba x Populus x berolinensis]
MYSSTVSMLMDVVSDGKIILCFCEEFLKMGISIEISFSAQQCCGGLSSKQLGCYNAWFILGTTFVELERKQPLPILYTSPLILISWSITCLRIQIPTSASQLLCPGEILLMCEEIKSSSRRTPFPL